MSIRIMSQVWEVPTIKGTEKLILLALADNANDDGYAWPSIGTVARKCGVSRRYAIDIINKLEQLGLLEIQHRRIDETKNQTNIYKVVIPTSLRVVNPSSPGSEPEITRGSEPEITRVVRPASPKPSFNHQLRTTNEPPEDQNSVAASRGIFALYEQTIGLIPTNLVDELKDYESEFMDDWLKDAFMITARNGKRNWSYTKAILDRWKADGKKSDGTKQDKATKPIESQASEIFVSEALK